MEKGLGFRMPSGTYFKKLFFKPLTGSTAVQTVSFYYGTVEVIDTRFNVISDAPLISVISRPSNDFFFRTILMGNLAIGANTGASGTFVDINQVARRARSLCVQHFTAGKLLTIQYQDPVDSSAVNICRVPANVPMEFIQGNNVAEPNGPLAPINFLITNNSTSIIDCDVYQTIWNS